MRLVSCPRWHVDLGWAASYRNAACVPYYVIRVTYGFTNYFTGYRRGL